MAELNTQNPNPSRMRISASIVDVLSMSDIDNPTTVNQANHLAESVNLLDYTKQKDVDQFIEFTSFEYKRGLSGVPNGRKKQIVVRLPLLGSITSSYNMNYTDHDMALFYDMITSGIKSISDGNLSGVSDAFKKGLGAFEQTAYNAASMGGEYSAELNNTIGVAKNPRQEATFVGIGMRSHVFAFHLIPRNAQENQMIQDISYLLKVRMHPELSTASGVVAQAFLQFPDEFVINFKCTKFDNLGNRIGVDDLNIPQIPDCMLAACDLIYNPSGQSRFFDDKNPSSYMLTMSFVEANQLTRNDIISGGY